LQKAELILVVNRYVPSEMAHLSADIHPCSNQLIAARPEIELTTLRSQIRGQFTY